MALTAIEKKTMRIAERLKNERLEREWSQETLANKAGIDRKTVNRIENGHFSPSMTTFLLLCEAMKVNAQDIIAK
jgi:DNA-binding XRE family transcriptional regulator